MKIIYWLLDYRSVVWTLAMQPSDGRARQRRAPMTVGKVSIQAPDEKPDVVYISIPSGTFSISITL